METVLHVSLAQEDRGRLVRHLVELNPPEPFSRQQLDARRRREALVGAPAVQDHSHGSALLLPHEKDTHELLRITGEADQPPPLQVLHERGVAAAAVGQQRVGVNLDVAVGITVKLDLHVGPDHLLLCRYQIIEGAPRDERSDHRGRRHIVGERYGAALVGSQGSVGRLSVVDPAAS
eukprot:6075946-Pyramimonas_sp.AAC.1